MAGWMTQRTVANIRVLIESGRLGGGGKLPPERKLAEALHVSRSTVRAAIGCLRDNGEVVTLSGRDGGTYVSRENPCWELYARPGLRAGTHAFVDHPTGLPQGIARTIEEQGGSPETRVLEVCRVPAGVRVATALGLEVDTEVLRVKRLRLLAGECLSYERAYLPPGLYPDLEHADFERPIYDLMVQVYGKSIGRISETLEVVSARREAAGLMGVPEGTVLILSQSVAYDREGVPIECSRDYYRSDRVRFVVDNVFDARDEASAETS